MIGIPMAQSPLDGYIPRSWSTYIIDIPEGMLLPTRPLTNKLVSLTSDSVAAAKLAEDPGYDASQYFFYDYEQIVTGHDVYGCGPVCELASEYEGHPDGKLLFVSYEGMENEVPNYTLFIEN